MFKICIYDHLMIIYAHFRWPLVAPMTSRASRKARATGEKLAGLLAALCFAESCDLRPGPGCKELQSVL